MPKKIRAENGRLGLVKEKWDAVAKIYDMEPR
jgi:hypothetical protein